MKPPILEQADPERILDLDVRPDLAAGREPFPRIMRAKAGLADDGILRLRAPFEPRPLYDVLGRDGFDHWTERLDEDDWRVWFFRGEEGAAPGGDGAPGVRPCDCSGPSSAAAGGGCGASVRDHADIHLLDVRGLEPPEPMVRTLEALASLPWGHTLLQINARVPRFLLPELEERGFAWSVVEESGERVRVAIRHEGPFPVVDVRLHEPGARHEAVFRAFRALERGTAFLLVADHDPLPLRRRLEAEHPGAWSWRYLEEGPGLWRIRIGRTA